MVLAEGEETPSPFKHSLEKLEDAENSSLRVLYDDGEMPPLENQTGEDSDHQIVTSISIFFEKPYLDQSIEA